MKARQTRHVERIRARCYKLVCIVGLDRADIRPDASLTEQESAYWREHYYLGRRQEHHEITARSLIRRWRQQEKIAKTFIQ